MLFLSFLLFSVIYIDGDNYVKIYRSSNDIDLFFVEQGFFSPAAGFGIVGADMNPAVLGKSDNVEFFAAVSLPGVSASDVDSISIKFEREGGDTVTDEVTLVGDSRLYGQYRSLGGFNFLGFSKRLGMFGVGVSYGAGYKLGVQASLSGSIYGTFQSNKLFEFTSDDFSEIGEDEVISINPEISGGVSIINPVPLRVEYSDAPIFIGGGYSYGPVAVGAGLKFQNCRIMGEGSFSARIDSLAVRLEDTVIVDRDGDDWIIEDFSAELEMDFDEDLFAGTISSTGLSTTHPLFTLGTLFDFPGVKLSLGFDFGGSYDLSGGYSWNFSAVSELPEDFVSIDSTNLSISEDALITGVAVIVIDSMIREEDYEFDDNASLTFAGSSFNFAFLLDTPLKFGFNGRLGFPVSDYSLNKLGLCLYSSLPVPAVGVDLGLAADCIFLGGSEVDDLIFIPSATFGLCFSYERDYLGFYLPVKYDASHIALAVLRGVLGKKDQDVIQNAILGMRSSSNIWDNLSFGLGFRVKM
jgi:hypothetical protein